MFALLILPDGARIESITATATDYRGGGSDLRVQVHRYELMDSGQFEVIAEMNTSGTGGTQQMSASNLDHVVDASDWQYVIPADADGPDIPDQYWDGTGSLRLHGVTIAYRQ